MTQPGVGDGTVSIGDDSLRGLLDHGIEVVDCFLVLAKLDVGKSPIIPGVEVVRFRFEGDFGCLQSRGGTLLRAGRRRCRSEIEVDQGTSLRSDVAGEVRFRQTVLEEIRVRGSASTVLCQTALKNTPGRILPGGQRPARADSCGRTGRELGGVASGGA